MSKPNKTEKKKPMEVITKIFCVVAIFMMVFGVVAPLLFNLL